MVQVFQTSLDFAHAHASGLQRDDDVIEALPVGLMLLYQLRFKSTVTVAGNSDVQRTDLSFQGLFALAIASSTGGIADAAMLLMPQMMSHLVILPKRSSVYG